jgi:hypothetical protein
MVNLTDLAAVASLSLDYFKSLIVGYVVSLILQLLPPDFVDTTINLIM